MKAMKKLFAMLLATLMMVGMLATTATAATVGTVTINHDHAGHIYEAYQIFAGDLHGGVLSNVEWGDGINPTPEFITKIQAIERLGGTPLAGKDEAAEIAEELAKWSSEDAALKKFADIVGEHLGTCHVTTTNSDFSDGKYTINFTKVGYFFLRDQAPSTALGEATATDYILQVVGNVSIEPKAVNPTFNKTVNNSLDGTYTEAMAVQSGDKVYFKLESKMPSMLADYRQYSLVFSETLPAGLTNLTVESVYIQPSIGSPKALTVGTHYTNTSTANSLSITTVDLLTAGVSINTNDTFVVKYSAMVDATNMPFGNAGGYGLVNTATLKFSNDMNQDKPINPEDVTRATLTDEAYLYSFGLDITKKNAADSAPLAGAQFVLYRNVSGVGNRYAIVDASGVITSWADNKAAASTLTSDEYGKIVVKGLGALSYYLEETEPPEGFNQMDAPLVVNVTPTIDAAGELTALNGTVDTANVTGDVADGLLDITVNNNPGTILPTTGGIGTTIFYIVGGVLVLGAGAAFVMKRRNEA